MIKKICLIFQDLNFSHFSWNAMKDINLENQNFGVNSREGIRKVFLVNIEIGLNIVILVYIS